MHIPDGFLSPQVWVAMDVVSAGTVLRGAKVVQKRLGERQVPALAVMAAFVFAAQMLNFPVAGGTSGHLLGAALVAILLGPWAGTLVMTTVIAAQCFLASDGGVTALGANIFNMGILGALAGYAVYAVVSRILGKRGRSVAAFAAGWVSVMLGAAATALQLVLSGVAAGPVVLPAMLGIHALIGVGEGLVTAAAITTLAATRPDLLELERV